jgi:hypothetical protein
MSANEQMAEIGGLVIKRTEAKREQVLLLGKIRETAEKLNKLGASLQYNLGDENQRRGVPILDDLMNTGGLDAFRSLLDQYNDISKTLASIEATLRDANVAL